jgi:FkbM family methyltransferase
MKFLTRTYAQLGQDILLHNMMQRRREEADINAGFYIDIGAYHPTKISNTFHFYQLGWSGLCIDPNPETEAAFKAERPRDKFVRCALSDQNGTLKYWRFRAATQNTCDPKVGERRRRKTPQNFISVDDVPVRTLDSVIKSAKLKQIDFLSIDVEGLELQILRGFDLKKHQPVAVVLESMERPLEHGKGKIFQVMSDAGYELVAHTGHDAYYLRV